jgi:hypothetical protein
VVEPWVLSADVDVDVGGRPTTAADAGADAATNAVEADRRGDGDTPCDTLEKHYQMELS